MFGSAAHPDRFTRWSDIDLVAWGIPAERFYAAVGAVTALSDEFEIDLLDVDSARPGVLREAEAQGAEL